MVVCRDVIDYSLGPKPKILLTLEVHTKFLHLQSWGYDCGQCYQDLCFMILGYIATDALRLHALLSAHIYRYEMVPQSCPGLPPMQ